MKFLKNVFVRLYRVKILTTFCPILKALESALFGTEEISKKSPFIRDNIDIKRYMTIVIIALLPSVGGAVYYYGFKVIEMILVSYISGAIVELAFAFIRKREIEEGFLVTGLIFPLILPPGIPLWVVALGCAFGVFFGKEVFGGTGRNIFNPALVGRLFVSIAFPGLISTSYINPVDSVTSATPLLLFKTTNKLTPLFPLLIGECGGSIGETFRIGIIVGGLFLMFTRISNWRIPITYIFSVFLFALVGNHYMPLKVAPPLFQILSGGLLFGAMFMATDPVTSPFTKIGKYIFGILCGFFTVLIRTFSGYPEGVMFSIILMNALTPLIDTFVLSLRFKDKKVA